ncbi:hypothetical protein [Aliiglaciecola aliphaticivorans]
MKRKRVRQKVRHIPVRLVIGFALLLLTAWGALALWYQVPQAAVRLITVALWAAAGLSMMVALTGLPSRKSCNLATVAFISAVAILAAWWSTLQPSHHRLWANDVAQLLDARIDGDHVQLKNVRNFEWRSETDYTPRWESRTYDLHGLVSDYSYAELQALGYINEHALASDASAADFSTSIRQGVPGGPANEAYP